MGKIKVPESLYTSVLRSLHHLAAVAPLLVGVVEPPGDVLVVLVEVGGGAGS